MSSIVFATDIASNLNKIGDNNLIIIIIIIIIIIMFFYYRISMTRCSRGQHV